MRLSKGGLPCVCKSMNPKKNNSRRSFEKGLQQKAQNSKKLVSGQHFLFRDDMWPATLALIWHVHPSWTPHLFLFRPPSVLSSSKAPLRLPAKPFPATSLPFPLALFVISTENAMRPTPIAWSELEKWREEEVCDWSVYNYEERGVQNEFYFKKFQEKCDRHI